MTATKTLIYDKDDGHFQNVRNSFLHTAPEGAEVDRVFNLSDSELEDYCIENNIDLLVIPLSGRNFRFGSLMQKGVHVVVAGQTSAPSAGSAPRMFGTAISVGGGKNEIEFGFGIAPEIYAEATNFSGAQSRYSSYATGALAGLMLSSGLLDQYTPFEMKQIVRQNASNYPAHSGTQGFGKVTEITDKDLLNELDVMKVQFWHKQPRNLLYFRVVEPFFSGGLKFYLNGNLTEPDAILKDDFSTWILLKGFGSTNQDNFTVTYFEPEVWNTDYIGANIGSYQTDQTNPVFNETVAVNYLVAEGDYKNYAILHRENIGGDIRRYDIVRVRLFDEDENELLTIITQLNLINYSVPLGLEDNTTYKLTFQPFANGVLYDETNFYTYNTATGVLSSETDQAPPSQEEVEEEEIEEPQDPIIWGKNESHVPIFL